ncbi:MAG TPA: amine oxidase [Solibacterales bacterium]|nr:amine oxidase [Bryobacterales bacterium]
MKAHTPLLANLHRTLSGDGSVSGRTSRRTFLKAVAAAPVATSLMRGAPSSIDVGIVGAGLAGLSCAHELKRSGVTAAIYEAAGRAGGRCHSMGGSFSGPVNFPGQVVERGGELIDNLHKTMLGYAKEFRLTLEDVGKQDGDVFYFFNGAAVPESRVVEEFRAFVPAMRADLRAISAAPSVDSHMPADIALDNVNLRQYLESRGAGPVVFEAIEQAYLAEYGRAIDEQSCLNFLLFIHADRRSKFTPFGVFSDERYHIVEGNESIARGLASGLSGQFRWGKRLVKAAKLASGRVRLTFSDGTTADHDAVVLTIPFTVLRQVDLSGLGLPAWKQFAIDNLGYGDNAKMMVGFDRPFWRALGSNGSSYADLANVQTTWETNPTKAGAGGAVLTDYSGGARGKNLNAVPLQVAAASFVGDLEAVFPGAAAAVSRPGGNIRAHLEHWPSNPLSQGSYTCYRPGQFTTIAGNEGKPAGNVFFAGEHTNSFYEWQGFMEGALLSGVQAAADLLRKK